MTTYKLIDARPWIAYDSFKYLPNEIEAAWRDQFAIEAQDLDTACAGLASTYDGTNVEAAAKAAMLELQALLSGKSLSINVSNQTVVYKPGAQGHGGCTLAIYPNGTVPREAVTIKSSTGDTDTIDIMPTLFLRLV